MKRQDEYVAGIAMTAETLRRCLVRGYARRGRSGMKAEAEDSGIELDVAVVEELGDPT
jgi:hypothetical protein